MNQTNIREIHEISIEDIIPNRFQPRLTFDTEALNELANSIREHGIIQPLVVRRLQDKYEIIAGERRYKAATLIGMKKVPCIIMDLNDNESAEVAVIENIQRKEMTPLEEAKSFKKILDKGYLTQDELARRMGKSQSSIANKLRLLNLDEVVQDAILEGKISERHARSLLKVEDKKEQRNLLAEIINNRLTVRQTDELIKEKYEKGGNNINTDQMNNTQNNLSNNMSMTFPQNNMNDTMSQQNNFNTNFSQPIQAQNNFIPNTQQQNTFPQEQQNSLNIFKEPVVEEKKVESNNYQEQANRYMSTPSVNIPVNNVINDVNPQLNLMHNIGIIDETPKEEIKPNPEIPQPSSSLDIFKMNSNTPITNNQSADIQSIINPSVLSSDSIGSNMTNPPQQPEIKPQTESYQPINNGMFVDINKLKNNAQDIMPKEENKVDMSSLLSNNNKPENKFFVDLNMPDDLNSNNLDNLPYKVKNSVTEINKKIEELKLLGVNITKEETDLGSTYQVIIRIDK